jgi:hypothetical protein
MIKNRGAGLLHISGLIVIHKNIEQAWRRFSTQCTENPKLQDAIHRHAVAAEGSG